MYKKSFIGLIFGIVLTGLFFCPFSYAENLNMGFALADDHGNILYGQNSETPFVPASILKLFTSLAAFHILGPDFQFSTHWYFDLDSKNLYIKGFGDPVFTSEVIERLVTQIILTAKPEQIHHIILDPTYFSGQIQVPGKGSSLNPYDAPVGALSANFNTLLFQWDKQKNAFVSGEAQTPLLPIFLGQIKKTGLKQGRIGLSREQSQLYPGYLIKFFLEKNNIAVNGLVNLGRYEAKQRGNIFVSPFDLKQIVQKLLKYSNNYMANHIFLALGAKTYGPPATIEKGIQAVNLFSKQHLGIDRIELFEGSGLSRSNQISCDQMIKVLIAFMPFHSLLNCTDKDCYKTGTLSDVRTRAGYISGAGGRLYPYAIMVNQENKGYEAILKKLLHLVSQEPR